MATLVAGTGLLVLLLVGFWVVERRRRSVESLPARRKDGSTALDTVLLGRLVVNALDQAVIVLNRDEQAVLVNHAARQMGVLANEELAFAKLAEFVRDVLITGTPVEASVDLPADRLGREPVALAVRAMALASDMDGRVTAVGLFLTDETDQRRLEAVRRDFVANVSHELKTPVGALHLLAEAIHDAADDPAAANRFAARIQHEAARLGRLVDELIELSRLQGADPLPAAAEVDLGEILNEAVRRTEVASERAGVDVDVRCGPSLRVRGNPEQLTTAVRNLVDNAIAYSGDASRVAVTAQAKRDENGRPVVDISVIDQGIGIPDTDRDRIFERFYRVDAARTRATGGSGLGLAIVKNIVQNHSGSVHVWSALEAGSTFTIRLPRTQRDQPSPDPTGETDPGRSTAIGVTDPGKGSVSTRATR